MISEPANPTRSSYASLSQDDALLTHSTTGSPGVIHDKENLPALTITDTVFDEVAEEEGGEGFEDQANPGMEEQEYEEEFYGDEHAN